MEDLVEPDHVKSVSECKNETSIHHHEFENPFTDHGNNVGEDFDDGPVKATKKRLAQLSDSESDDDNNIEEKSKLHQSIEDYHSDKNDTESVMKSVKKRMQQFADSESDCDKENKGNVSTPKSSCSDNDEHLQLKSKKKKSRIHLAHKSDSSDSESSADEGLKNEQQQLRMKNKRDKLKDKFKSFVTARLNESHTEKLVDSHSGSESDDRKNKNIDCSEQSDNEESSIERIKQNVKNKSASYKTTICDPDTSDEENYSSAKTMPQKMKDRRIAKLTPPKPVQMTAKQAMENMKKIKSESNRMLREKEVTLPYHRPKALSLKDIMSRRKPAVSSDGKSLPIKMNDEQLKQYVKILEERQKEMMELCKSDTDDDPDENEPDKIEESSNISDDPKTSENKEFQADNKVHEDNINKTSGVNTVVGSGDNILTNNKCVNEDEVKNTIDKTSADIVSDAKECENIENLADQVCNLNNITDKIKDVQVNKSVNNIAVTANDSMNTSGENIKHDQVNKSMENIAGTANDSLNSSASNAEMSLVYNDSIEENNMTNKNEGDSKACEHLKKIDVNKESEPDSQLVSLHYDSEKTEIDSENVALKENEPCQHLSKDISDVAFDEVCKEHDFSDDDMINIDEIDNLLENADIIKDNNDANFVNSPMLINDPYNSTVKPKLAGAPGMVIDLDGTDAVARKKLTGLELLKERFTYFAKLKTPDELEREKEKRLKPGAQHLKLKHELEEKIAEQRSLEWAKRLEEEKKQRMDIDAIKGDDESEDEIEKIEAKIDEKDETLNEESSESEESEEEMQEVKEKPRKRNPMIDDEAEESDDEEYVVDQNEGEEQNDEAEDADVEENNEESDDSSEESSESEEEMEGKTKKGRILKAFEDSDDEDGGPKDGATESITIASKADESHEKKKNLESQVILDSQDEDLQLAQRHKSLSGDLFTSQESTAKTQSNVIGPNEETDIGTQTFSILNDAASSMAIDLDDPEKIKVISETQADDDPSLDAVVGMCSGSFTQNLMESQLPSTGLPVGDKLTVISETQPNDEPNLDSIVGMCSGSFSQNLVTTQLPEESQPIGEDILNLCTGKFYDNKFVSQINNDKSQKAVAQDNEETTNNKIQDNSHSTKENKKPIDNRIQDANLKSILDELNDPEFEEPKTHKYFMDNTKDVSNAQFKKKFIIDSDDESNDNTTEIKQTKKIKKKKLEKRALHISDDEEDLGDEEFENDAEEQEYMSDIEENSDRLVEYDSEENEVIIKPQKEKKKRKMAEFFEQEAELTSEDEWVGSGDEDEAGLDRMEREAGDDDTFSQRRLQRELGQIHMRDVLDQDKREVRLIQELLFEDGDLGDGHRQRKFRWRNADGEEEVGTVPGEFADTQEEEMESEEQWRKQRHERELFLRQMQKQDDDEPNVSINRTTIIKANLCSRTMSSLLSEANKTVSEANTTERTDSPVVLEKKSSKDIHSPKKAFTVFKQNYHGSLLSRGGGVLSRLCALAAPLADDAGAGAGVRPLAGKGNFVFAALTPKDPEPKVTKRKADANMGTPRLVKKMKTEDKKKPPRSSLLDHLKV